jgi:hypothetical protein
MPKDNTVDDYMKLEGWKDYFIIEAYQYIPNDLDRSPVIRQIEAARTQEEAKEIIGKWKA